MPGSFYVYILDLQETYWTRINNAGEQDLLVLPKMLSANGCFTEGIDARVNICESVMSIGWREPKQMNRQVDFH